MIYKLKIRLFLFLLILCLTPIKAHTADSSDLKKEIVCGVTVKGEDIKCDTSTHKCMKCKKFIPTLSIFNWHTLEEYTCVPPDVTPKRKCDPAPNGGRIGEKKTKAFGITISKEKGSDCVVANFAQKYAYCYGCEVVETMANAFIAAAGHAYDVSRKSANAILVVASILWIAFFVLKSVSSFATIEPMKMLQDFMVQCFKILVAFTIINSGIQTILHYTLVPIMNAGTDFGSAILLTAPSVEIKNTGGGNV